MITDETYRKVAAIEDIARRAGLPYFVETGSDIGNIIGGLLESSTFERYWTVEIDHNSYKACVRRFLLEPKVMPIFGDSGVVLQEICQLLPGPAVWFLDAHYNEGHTRGPQDCPLLDELAHIFYTHPRGQWILVDDGRLMGTEPGYPSIDEITAHVERHGAGEYAVVPDYVDDLDVILIHAC